MSEAEARPLPAGKVAAATRGYLPPAAALGAEPLPAAVHVALYLLGAVLVAALVWAWAARVEKVVVAQGRLVTTEPTIVVQPIETAVIRSIDVTVGQRVKKGQVLVTFDPTFAEADAAQLEGRYRALEAQIARLEAEADDRPYRVGADASAEERIEAKLNAERRAQFAARVAYYAAKSEQIRTHAATNAKDQEMVRALLEVRRQVERMRLELQERSAGSRLQVLEAQNARLDGERTLARAQSESAELRQELATIEAEHRTYVTEWNRQVVDELVKARRERNEAAEQLAKARRRSGLVIVTAPTDATVLELAKRSVGSVLREGEALMTLVPAAAMLEAEVEVETRDVGEIRAGDAARLKLEAFPYQRYGTLPATVRTVSSDSFVKEQGGASVITYRARLRAAEPTTEAEAALLARLQPGLTVTGEVDVGERRLIEYLIYPILRVFDEGMREP